MRRRMLRIVSSSDEDNDDDELPRTLALQNPNPNPNPSTTPASNPPSPPLEISDDDDDFVDVPDDLSPPSPPPPPPVSGATPLERGGSGGGGGGPVRSIEEFLGRLGLRLLREWLESCVAALAGPGSGFEAMDVAARARSCFEQFLFADMNLCGGGVLPENVCGMHKAELEGPFVLQVDEIVNISASIRERYQDAPAGSKRCLKLSMTDGVQRVFGMEYRPIKDLQVLAPAGLKVVIRNVHVRRGLLMLVPEVLEVLGGVVDDLDAARRRLVEEVNKPPRGKRKQVVLPLSKRASLAAWPSTATNNGAQENAVVTENRHDPQPTGQATIHITEQLAEGTIIQQPVDTPVGENNTEAEHTIQDNETMITEDSAAPYVEGNNAEPQSTSSRQYTEPDFTGPVTSGGEVTPDSDMEDAVDDVEHPLILSGDKEIPFTYLACLLAKWTVQKDRESYIQGNIKCFLTGVKGFQFKNRSKFELHVYVDDGSLISEVLIDHSVVQKGIGHSPEEVTAALSSSEKKIAADMRETLKRFQLFLAKFEGTMLVEINGSSPLPTVLEMNQSCSTSDAWLLLRRLKMFAALQDPRNKKSEPIDISP
ncbi:recQ-mediated genome instability protein 1 [Ananas comosus]|uniref:RecQ-mediated genome instability protein 1 n=2 Tax=Ananas comosus TaxID=4615 RepID=A0A6P5GNC4_ANACO|nr:recQ-mediated genome instability protein 1 [Ananas comosus]XP_020106869.1 recQ-mediated genome instability protein 1 [Ananas comosus]XP_020106870.1 recQ-mediated genome instability protein 1 [Ananas comosus]XP_020106871.1 recQ-mediated genome instability protein 1 [Ananas comosus]XP_020106872.1 recQ-mediated genome instability protein 1 [Ananas comosus]XP_020106873.1 recQ-mediated genome instability protein 1 [Ananas comosus]CAD1820170.1 unnamed protein product [Ananas comosus var. bractea